jgi:hypothetical protein
MTRKFELEARAKKWIDGIKKEFSARPLPSARAFADPAFKML